MILMSNAMMGAAGYQASSPGGSFLQQYPGAAAAYSLRDLNGSGGAVVNLYHNGTAAARDFTADEITDGTLAAWVIGSTDVRVEIIYDQSGNNRHIVKQVSAARIALNEAVLTDSGHVYMNFNRLAFMEVTGEKHTPVNMTLAGVYHDRGQTNYISRPYGITCEAAATSSAKETFAITTDQTLRFDGAFLSGSQAVSWDQRIRITTKADAWITDHINGAQNIAATSAINTSGYINIGAPIVKRFDDPGNHYEGYFFELVIWFDDLSSDRSSLFSAINGHYGFY